MAAQFALYPIDAMRTLKQTRAGAKSLADLGAAVLVSGCATTSTFALAVGAIQFSVVGVLAPRLGILAASVCGALASCAVSVPQEVIKQRLVTGIYADFGSAVTSIAAADGVAGFYTAWLPTLSRNVPFVVFTFCTFEAIKARLLRRRAERQRLSHSENLLIGVSAALAAGLVTQPVDVVKTRLMTQAATGALPYAGIVDCVLTMARTEGLGSFYCGIVERSLYMGPLWALQFSINGWLLGKMLESESSSPGARRGEPGYQRLRAS